MAGKIPYIITKEKGVYFDVVKNRKIGEETALQLVSRFVALLLFQFNHPHLNQYCIKSVQ